MKSGSHAWVRRSALLAGFLLLSAVSPGAAATRLSEHLGRNEVRVYSAAHRLTIGDSVIDTALAERLEQAGYQRVHSRPAAAGEFFWGYETFWVFLRSVGRTPAALVEADLRRATGRIENLLLHDSRGATRAVGQVSLQPQVLAESLSEVRAERRPVELDRLPEHVWQAVLAIEDARFFAHGGVDPRSVARAMLKNARAGKVTQGGSTITQQLVKVRDLSPKRSMGRKASEAVRALALEAEYSKHEILEAYLNAVYLGHVEGVAVYGIGAAARTYFSKSAYHLSLREAALLAGMIQGPNRLQPVRHPERARSRQQQVLRRMQELDWIGDEDADGALRQGLPPLRLSPPRPALDRRLLAALDEKVSELAPKKANDGRGFVVRTALDPLLQSSAEKAVAQGLQDLRRRRPDLRRVSLSAALVALDGRTGDILAYVGGDPSASDDGFDRAARARRQPGSTVKPLVLLEAFESCGRHSPLDASRRVLDAPVTIDLPTGAWRPANSDDRFRGTVSVRRAMVESLNVPLVRIGRHCGFEETGRRFERAGLKIPETAPPSLVLGAVEASPLEMASAYTVFTSLGDRLSPRLIQRLELPGGRRLANVGVGRRRLVRPTTAYMVRDLLRQSVERGTARRARISGREVIGKTGTSSDRRDAWFVGASESVVAALWIGVDSGASLGGEAGRIAAPVWKTFMEQATTVRPRHRVGQPSRIVERWIDPRTGLSVGGPRDGAERYLFRRGEDPPRRRPWRRQPLPVIE